MHLVEMGKRGFLLVFLMLFLAFICSRCEKARETINTDEGFDSKVELSSGSQPLKVDNSFATKQGEKVADRVEVGKSDLEAKVEPGKSVNSAENESGKNSAEGERVEGSEHNKSSLEKKEVPDRTDNGLNSKETLGMETNKNGEQKQDEKKDGGLKQDEKKEEMQREGEQKQDEKKEDKQTEVEQKQDDKKVVEDKQPAPKIDSSPAKQSRKDNSRAEECDDASKRCTDEKHKLVACLRVPGSESPHLSLLIQNKGTEKLPVKITGPDFILLENTTVQLLENEDIKVTVSIVDSIRDNSEIVLTTGDGRCTLDLKDTISDYYGQNSLSRQLMTWTSALYFSLFTILLIGAAWLCLRFRRRRRHGDGAKYQEMEMGLPVSNRGKLDTDTIDGWDNSWGDSWDDEEAPITPSKPAQNLSSKGLASRRSSKDGSQINNWKD